MNYVVILSGGSGTRIKDSAIPKQYIEICGKPMIKYGVEQFDTSCLIDGIVIVCALEWREMLNNSIGLKSKKFLGYADAGSSRQESVLNGLLFLKNFAHYDDIVIIQDAARPFTTHKMIEDCVNGAKEMDGAMPAIPVKDTVYCVKDDKTIDKTLNRDYLYAGQSPEAFLFGKYFDVNITASKEEISLTRGSSEIAVKNGMRIKIVMGDENNFKITTNQDLERCKQILEKK
ncbi:MAG: IspD/TarI family cytidylyltransferase [Clostridia bacterium]